MRARTDRIITRFWLALAALWALAACLQLGAFAGTRIGVVEQRRPGSDSGAGPHALAAPGGVSWNPRRARP